MFQEERGRKRDWVEERGQGEGGDITETVVYQPVNCLRRSGQYSCRFLEAPQGVPGQRVSRVAERGHPAPL